MHTDAVNVVCKEVMCGDGKKCRALRAERAVPVSRATATVLTLQKGSAFTVQLPSAGGWMHKE